jgi:hypothetical protein
MEEKCYTVQGKFSNMPQAVTHIRLARHSREYSSHQSSFTDTVLFYPHMLQSDFKDCDGAKADGPNYFQNIEIQTHRNGTFLGNVANVTVVTSKHRFFGPARTTTLCQ